MHKDSQEQEAAVRAEDKEPGMVPWREHMEQSKQGLPRDVPYCTSTRRATLTSMLF